MCDSLSYDLSLCNEDTQEEPWIYSPGRVWIYSSGRVWNLFLRKSLEYIPQEEFEYITQEEFGIYYSGRVWNLLLRKSLESFPGIHKILWMIFCNYQNWLQSSSMVHLLALRDGCVYTIMHTHTRTHTEARTQAHTQSCTTNLVGTHNSVPFKILFSLTPNTNLNPKT